MFLIFIALILSRKGSEILLYPEKTLPLHRNITITEMSYTIKDFEARAFYEQHYLIPIPQTEIDKNSKLEQNPGY